MAKSPSQLDEFEILHRLGAGGMAEVFLAKKRGAEGTYKLLVVKRILPAHVASRRFRSMFVEEAQLATRLNHPNIVQVYEFSDHGDEGLLLSMEYVEGFDLGKLMNAAKQKGARLPPLIAAFIASEAARGLHYAHERKDEGGMPLAIVHRDVSPQNILLSHEGVVKIADFGIATANLFREEPGVLKGKFGYMSPEQARGERVDRRSDIYALGVVLYEMLTLRSPYKKRDDDGLLKAVQEGDFEPPSAYAPDLPPEIEALVMRAMARDPEARYQTARDFAGAIARVLLAKQELVDNASVETTLTHLLGREHRPSVPDALKDQQPQTMAAVPLARMEGGNGNGGAGGNGNEAGALPRAPAAREVRHVAVITLRLRGVEDLEEAQGPLMGRLRGAGIRAILDEIAYKRHAVWSWDAGPPSGHPGRPHVGVTARAIVGLLDNPSRAAADAAWLAVDAHEALAGASEDFPIELQASIGIVRGIATGERDAQGHLVHHTLQEPANFLADQVGQGTPFGKTWVAGGVFRLVRRDFRWGDAPSITILAPSALVAPRQMRLYALERPLTREEQQDELTLAPNDLVGRDAEKADLSAAFHRAANPGYDGEARAQGFEAAEAAESALPSFEAALPSFEATPPTFEGPLPTLEGPLPSFDTADAPLPPAAFPPAADAQGTRISIAPPERGVGRAALAPQRMPVITSQGGSLPAPSIPPPASAIPLDPAGRGELIARAVVGEMGIGKTALVRAFLAELPAEARVVAVECSPVQSELPLATVSDLLRNVTGAGLEHSIEQASILVRERLGSAGRSTHAPRITARLAELVTGKQIEQADDDAASYQRDLVLLGVRALLGNLASSGPLVIVIDGLQWADRPSLELLQELMRRKEARPILVLLVTRPDDRVAPFLEGMVRIELRGLSADEQMRLVEARLGVRQGVAAVCRELVPRVAGNPFFLLEMIDALLERGTLEIVDRAGPGINGEGDGDGDAGPASRGRMALVRHERAGGGSEPLPSTLEQIIGDRLRELPPAEHDIVDWLAVAGGPLLENDLIALARLADDEAVTRLCARGVCDRKIGSVDFRHPLARDVAYLALDAPSRVRMHRRLGEHLAQTPLAHGLSAAIVARHLARGEDPSAAAELYIEAGNAARNSHQSPLAQRYYQRALTLLPASDSRRMLAHESLEAIYRNLGRRRERRSHLTALRKLARESGQARWAALALVRTARLELDEGYLVRGLPIAQRATEVTRIARKPALEVEALTILSEILRELGDIPGAIDAVERALQVASAGGLAARARAEVLRAKGVLLRYGGRVNEAVEAYAEAIAVFRVVGARRAEARAKNALAYAMFVLERFEDAIAVGLSSVSIDLAIGGRFQIAKTLSNVGQAYARLGDTQRGLAYLKRARDAHERYGDQDSRADTLLCTAGILLEAGDIDAAHTLAGDAGALIAVTGSVYDLAHERIVRALLAHSAGDAKVAVAHASEARRLTESQGLVSYHAYATAIEAVARVAAGEVHSGVLLARTALGTVEAVASEYGLEVRALSCEALRKGAPQSAREASLRAVAHVRKVRGYVREPRLAALFLRRPIVERILAEAQASGVDTHVEGLRDAPLRGAMGASGAPISQRPPVSSRAFGSRSRTPT